MKFAATLVPAALVVILCLGMKFPPTERAASGITYGPMFRELLKTMFIVLFCSMFLTAASELAPRQWVDFALRAQFTWPGILLLVYVSGTEGLSRVISPGLWYTGCLPSGCSGFPACWRPPA